jgi:hypothetical protein
MAGDFQEKAEMHMFVVIRRSLALVAIMVMLSPIARAEEATTQVADTRLFSLQVPAVWKVRGDGKSILLAGGPRIVDGVPTPMLSAQYCVEEMTAQSVGLTPCSDSCELAAQQMLSEFSGSMVLGKLESTRRGQTNEFRLQGKAKSGKYMAEFALSCNPLGRAYVSLASDGPAEGLNAQFEAIMQTLQWRTAALPQTNP